MELLSVIFVLGLLTTIITTTSINIINESNQKAYNLMVVEIEVAAREYVSKYSNILTTITPSNPQTFIYLSALQNQKLVASPIINPITKLEIPPSTPIFLTREGSGVISYIFIP